MRPLIFPGAIFLLVAGLVPARAADSATLVVRLTGLRSDSGRVMVLVYQSEDGYMKDDRKAVARANADIHGGVARVEIRGLVPGTYALSCFHDENGNGRLDTNWIGIPKEGVGASNGAKGHMGPPKWKDAHFPVVAPATEHAVKIVYV
jgi:uncharacterized protein (DUF2141 family)